MNNEAAINDQVVTTPRGRFDLGPIGQRRWELFKANRRSYWALWLFLALFVFSLFAELVANDKPFMVWYKGGAYWPAFVEYLETDFDGDFPTEAVYRDPWMKQHIADNGFAIWPLIKFHHTTVDWDLDHPAPAPPGEQHILGTDDQARDVIARVIYGFRISGAIQGYFGGWLDLLLQRFMEVWASMPTLYILIILASVVEPNFWWLLGILLLFSWMGFVGVVRAEFLRARKFEYVRAARALGVGDTRIILRHVLPNALVATITFMPFTLAGSVTILTSLDFLGFGLPPGSPSLGEILAQGKANLQAPWLGVTGFVTIGLMLSLLIFIGEGVRDAFDPRKLFR
jgi:microcin C transport system permease protein